MVYVYYSQMQMYYLYSWVSDVKLVPVSKELDGIEELQGERWSTWS